MSKNEELEAYSVKPCDIEDMHCVPNLDARMSEYLHGWMPILWHWLVVDTASQTWDTRGDRECKSHCHAPILQWNSMRMKERSRQRRRSQFRSSIYTVHLGHTWQARLLYIYEPSNTTKETLAPMIYGVHSSSYVSYHSDISEVRFIFFWL